MRPGLLGQPAGGVPRRAQPGPARHGRGRRTTGWSSASAGPRPRRTAQATPRNLLGFKDGTRNIKAEQTDLMNNYVWAGQETDQPWLRGGSYLVARKIRMFVENWDRDYLQRPGEGHRPGQGQRRAAVRRHRVHHARLPRHRRPAARDRHPGGRPHPAGQLRAQRRHPDPAPRLLVHRRHRSAAGHAAGRPVLHRVHEEPGPVHQAPAVAGRRRPERVHPAHRQRRVRLPARRAARASTGATACSPEATGAWGWAVA